jgi:hypothetical protein
VPDLRFVDGLFQLNQPLTRAQSGGRIELIADISLTNMDPDETVVFEIDRGYQGSTEVELMNYLGTEPVAVDTFVWDQIKPGPANTSRFEIPAASLTNLRIASIDLGSTNEEHGLVEIREVPDGLTKASSTGGTEARVTVANGWPTRYIYFKAHRDFRFAQETHLRVTVQYFDQGNFNFWLDYDSTDSNGIGQGRYKDTQSVWLTDSGVWKTATFDLPDVLFAGRQNGGADFRIATSDNSLYINTVTVTIP